MSNAEVDADAHYAGRGIRSGAKQPIFWYKPSGEGKYRILSADWTWTESEIAPDVKHAVKLGGFPKAEKTKNGK